VTKKMIEEDLSRVEESATKSTYKLGIGFERCQDKGEKSAPKFVLAPIITKMKNHSNPLPIQSKTILQPQERCEEKYSKSK
jgi:hypothetical protein